MKKSLLLLLLLAFCTALSLSAQDVYLYIPNLTSTPGGGVHSTEARINTVQHGSALAVSSGGGGAPTPSKPSFSDFVFSKIFDFTSLRLQEQMLRPSMMTTLEIRYYNSQDVLVYVITLEDVFITSLSSTSTEDACPSGCYNITESYTLTPTSKIIYRNRMVTPNQILTYDLRMGRVQ